MKSNQQKPVKAALEQKHQRRRKSRKSAARWLSYAAAGAATIAAGQHTNADVVINSGNIGPGDLPIEFPGELDLSIPIDLDNDGSFDVSIIHDHEISYYDLGGGQVVADGTILGHFASSLGNQGEACTSPTDCYHYAIRFTNLSSIGPARESMTNAPDYFLIDGPGFPTYSGWAEDPSAGFLGVRFEISGNTHFGFVEIEIDTGLNERDQPGNIPTILSYGYESIPNSEIGFTPIASGDFDMDGEYTCDDIDLLYGEISAGTHDPAFDLTSDALVNGDDVGSWLAEAGSDKGYSEPIRPGDADLNGVVNATDLNVLGLNWQATDATSWCQADFNHDANVNSADLNDIGINWLSDITVAANATASVPEPNSLGLMALGATGLLGLRRFRKGKRGKKTTENISS